MVLNPNHFWERASDIHVMTITLDSIPTDLRELVFVWYRVGIRKRMAQRQLHLTHMKRVNDELGALFEFCNGDYRLLILGYLSKGTTHRLVGH